MQEIISINGIKYEVVKSETPEQIEARGLHNMAADMRRTKCSRHLGLKRPNGKRIYFSKEFIFKPGVPAAIAYTPPFSLI